MIRGVIEVPGDKSITHRALILAALAQGTSEIKNPLRSLDCQQTVHCLRKLGVRIAEYPSTTVVEGVGVQGFREPDSPLDCGNSGTTMRLLAGVLATQPFLSVITGDNSLLSRPMNRIVEPLKQMGALIKGRDGDQYAPLAIRGGLLTGISYALPVASAQVKSALLLAGLGAQGELRLGGRIDSRDHTEQMMKAFGVDISHSDGSITLRPGNPLQGQTIDIPGDISSAAFFVAVAAAVPGSYVEVRNVGLNPTRTGFLDVLQEMGADIDVVVESDFGEPQGRIIVRGRTLQGVIIGGSIIPRLIDELPVLAVTAALAQGTTVIKDAGELKVKETNRIRVLAEELGKLGVQVTEQPDGLIISGPTKWRSAVVDSHGDHRLAMALLACSAVVDEDIHVINTECIDVSFPGFQDILGGLCAAEGEVLS